MQRTSVNETECRSIRTVKVLKEEGLSMESVDGDVLAATSANGEW